MINYTNVYLAMLASLAMFCCGCSCPPANPGTSQPQRVTMSQTSIDTWNSLAATYNFDGYPQSVHSTFGTAYNGSDFTGDAADITAAMNSALGTDLPPVKAGDAFNTTIGNWGS